MILQRNPLGKRPEENNFLLTEDKKVMWVSLPFKSCMYPESSASIMAGGGPPRAFCHALQINLPY